MSDDGAASNARSTATKTCPQCAEEVKAEARVCRFCEHEFAPLATGPALQRIPLAPATVKPMMPALARPVVPAAAQPVVAAASLVGTIDQELQLVSAGWSSPFTYAANDNHAGRAALAQVTSVAASHGYSASGPQLLGDGRLQLSFTPTAAQRHSGVRVSRAGIALALLVLLVVAAGLANMVFTGRSQDAAGAFAAFETHVVGATVEEAGPTALALYADARAGNVAAAKADAQSLGSWARGETAWLASHPAAACYAAVYGVWTGMVGHAQKASDALLAGDYIGAASETDAFSFASSDLTSMLGQVRC